MVATTPRTPDRQIPSSIGWIAVTRLMALMTFAQAFFAGMLLAGYPVGRDAHRANAYSLVGLTLVCLIAALTTRRHTEAGQRLIRALVSFVIGLAIVAALGILSREGYRLHWAHLPAGIAMMGSAGAVTHAASALSSPTGT